MNITPILNRVTVTGADDSISPDQLCRIQDDYPFAEFGILLSNRYSTTSAGAPRFPSRVWLKQLRNLCRTVPLHLSGHLCGLWVRNLLLGHWPDLKTGLDTDVDFEAMFRRWQINTHAEGYDIETDGVWGVLEACYDRSQTVIFQLDGRDGALAAESFKHLPNVVGLFDLSHGAGRLPSEWPKPIAGLPCGYAGGLSPTNVIEQLARIQEVVVPPTWIDAETHLRSDNSDSFDLDKVRAFLEAAKPWVLPEYLVKNSSC